MHAMSGPTSYRFPFRPLGTHQDYRPTRAALQNQQGPMPQTIEHSTKSLPATRPRQRVEAITDTAVWASEDEVYPCVPDFHEPHELYPGTNSEDRPHYHPMPLAERLASMSRAPVRKPSGPGQFSSGLFTTGRFGPRTTVPAELLHNSMSMSKRIPAACWSQPGLAPMNVFMRERYADRRASRD
jgi:hypothetical protein